MGDTAIAERTMPHNIEAEQAVLGAAMLRQEAFDEAAGVLSAADFYRDAHRRIWEHMARLAARRVEIDTVTLKDSLRKAGELDEAGGPVYLAQLLDGVPHSTHVAHYARIVRDRARLRAVIHAAAKMSAEAYDASDDAATVIDQAERTLLELTAGRDDGGFKSIGSILPGVLDQIEAWSESGGVTGLSTGLRDVDRMTRGLHPGNLVIIAARPSMGKSALAMNLGKNIAAAGHTVGVFSLEMSGSEIGVRVIADEGRIDGHALQRGKLGQSEYGRLTQALGTLEHVPLYIDESPFLTVFDIRSRARRLMAERGLSLIIIDYVQLLVGHVKNDNRALELAAVSRMLKAIAKELRIPVVVLSQLSRDLEKRVDKRPMLSDLRESGALEQDADVVWFIYRPAVYDKAPKGEFQSMGQDEYDTLAELIIAKQRNGPIGTVYLSWWREHTLFTDRHAERPGMAQRLPMEG